MRRTAIAIEDGDNDSIKSAYLRHLGCSALPFGILECFPIFSYILTSSCGRVKVSRDWREKRAPEKSGLQRKRCADLCTVKPPQGDREGSTQAVLASFFIYIEEGGFMAQVLL
jgi:hypothetical protein